MSKIFKYSLLQYTQSQLSGEIIVVGIIFFFEGDKKVYFTYSEKKVKRLSSLYNEFSESVLLGYLRSFRDKTTSINFEYDQLVPNIFPFNSERILHSEFLIEDSTSLRFGEVKTAVQFSSDLNIIVQEFYKAYFKEYEEKIILDSKPKHDERYLINTYKNLLISKTPAIKDLLEENRVVSTENVILTFDIAWQNGSLNLVKAISFDLQEEKNIIDKSLTNFGYFSFLSHKANEDNLHFDLIISKPEKKELKEGYLKAKKILNNIKAPISIIEEDNIESYSEKTIAELLK